MFEPNHLIVGDVFYGIRKNFRAMHRHKVYKFIDGVEWFKYSEHLFTYSITHNKVVGILSKTVEAEDHWDYVSKQFDAEPEFCILTTEGTMPGVFSDPMTLEGTEDYFHSSGDAYLRIAELENEANELDRK
jgi:hypothetical protein